MRYYLLSFGFCMVYSVFVAGCVGRPVQRDGAKHVISATDIDKVTSVNGIKRDLSMAKELRSSGSDSEYVLGPADMLQVSVYGQDELGMDVAISPTGKISYYLMGDIQAAGLTRFQLRDKIRAGLSRYIKDPQVVVRISEYGSHKVIVLGQVKVPGVFVLKGRFSLLEAISSAGGVTPDAYLGGAYVVRDGKILLVNFYQLIEKGNTEENIPLLSDDVVYIPDNRDRKIFVLGEVHRQAAIPIGEKMTLLEAVAEAGGFTRDAEKDSVVILRGNLSEPEIITINAKNMKLAAKLPLQQGDIIYVAKSTFASVEQIALRLSHILQPFLDVTRGIILQDASVDVLKGEQTRYIIGD